VEVLITHQRLAELYSSLADQIIAKNISADNLFIAGIQQGGVVVANILVGELQKRMPAAKINYGQLDITFYRDDIRKEILQPDTMNMPFNIEDKTIILIDDVLFTGRTIKAALDTLLDLGRPAKVELCVLVDRKEHRQFPIQADYVGITVATSKTDKVKLVNGEVVLL
jgi:pyrimidine operon attenuation protein / uracil phosphoribosyltransferase